MCTCLYNEIRNGFPYRPQKISRKCSFAVSMRTSIQTISSDRMPWYGSSWSIDDLQKHRARESVRKREKKWISFKPPEILIWASKRAAATTSTAKAFPIWRLCWVCARTEQIPSIWWKMLCLGIEWKIRIIFFNTTINHFVCVCVCGYKLYSVYFVSVCWFDILARIQTELLSFIHFLTLWLSSILFASSPLAVQFSYHVTNRAKQRFVEIHLNEFRMWNDCYFSTSIIYYNVHVSGGENGSALPISSWNIPNAKQPNYI